FHPQYAESGQKPSRGVSWARPHSGRELGRTNPGPHRSVAPCVSGSIPRSWRPGSHHLSLSKVLLDGFLGDLLEELGSLAVEPGCIWIANGGLAVDGRQDGTGREVGPRHAGMALVGVVEVDSRILRNGPGEGETCWHHQRTGLAACLGVLLDELGGHLRAVRVGPGHEEDGAGPMLHHGLTV